MIYSTKLHTKAVTLRKKGFSIKEVARLLNLSTSTTSLWLRKINLDCKATERLEGRKRLGRINSALTKQRKKELITKKIEEATQKSILNNSFDPDYCRILCSLLYWAEGSKSSPSYVSFINSDPNMISVFLKLLRISFKIEEPKLRALIHLHEYHKEKEIKKFWSEITNISLDRFSKSYLKPHSGKRIKLGYMGSIRIRYYDAKVALELRSTYNTLTNHFRGVVQR
jgi:predicted transcriptional regulator